DVVNGGPPDAAIRPNQILAVSLRHSMLSRERAASVVATVERELLTPVGLRSLSPADPRYLGRYEGDQRSRDAAYHQGTVWPWLLGPFFEAYLKINEFDAASRQRVSDWMKAWETELESGGLGQISEIYDGDAPHRPVGCTAQAWSVAELLRIQALLATTNESAAKPSARTLATTS